MQDQSHLVAIASYGTLLAAVTPVLQSRNWTAVAILPFLVFLAYAFIRLKWRLPERLDEAFEKASPFGFLIAIAIVGVVLAAKSMSGT